MTKKIFHKYIKITSIVIFFTFFFNSCYVEKVQVTVNKPYKVMVYYLYEFAADNMDSSFVYKDTNILIKYMFFENDKFSFEIMNITDTPIFLDLGKSSLIVNYKAVNYTKALDHISRYFFIPNMSKLTVPNYDANLLSEFEIFNYFTKVDSMIEYSSVTSPIQVRNHITFGFDEELKKSYTVENKIWLSKVIKMKEKEFSRYKDNYNKFSFYYSTVETEMRPVIEEIDGKKKFDKRSLLFALIPTAMIATIVFLSYLAF